MNRNAWISALIAGVLVTGIGAFLLGDQMGTSNGRSLGYASGYNDGLRTAYFEDLVPMGASLDISPTSSLSLLLTPPDAGSFTVTLHFSLRLGLENHTAATSAYSVGLTLTGGPSNTSTVSYAGGSSTSDVGTLTINYGTDSGYALYAILAPDSHNPGPVVISLDTEMTVSFQAS